MTITTSDFCYQADEPGTFPGLSAQFSGAGFADMRFDVHAVPPDEYAKWAADTKAIGAALDKAAYAELAKPSKDVKPAMYKSVEQGMFDAIVNDTMAPAPKASGGIVGHDVQSSKKGT